VTIAFLKASEVLNIIIQVLGEIFGCTAGTSLAHHLETTKTISILLSIKKFDHKWPSYE